MRSPGIVQVAAGAALISFSPVFVKIADVGPTMAGFYRTLFGGAFLAVLVLLRRDRVWAGPRAFVFAVLCGVIFATDLSFWHRSIRYIGPGLATIVGNFEVFFVAAFGILVFREKAGWRYLVAVPLALAGLFLLVGVDWPRLDPDYKLGVMFGLATAIMYATFLLILQREQSRSKRLGATANLCVMSFVTAAVMGIEALVQKESFRIPDAKSWAALLSYGVICQAIAWVVISRALPRVEVSKAGLILLLQPTLAFVWDVVFFARPTDAVDVAGAVLALSAIYLGTSRAQRETAGGS